MDHLAHTYMHIAAILSFDTSNAQLEQQLSNPKFDWDIMVVVGSRQLVLPAMYCRLKAKQLLHVLPKDLEVYLEELTAINRNRNTSILHQIHVIAQLLKEHQIDHVFLKGAALIASECYQDKAERMVGDIDILVSKDQLHTAFDLIKRHGYDKTLGFDYQTLNYRHLDRLISPNALAAIELHDELLIPKYRNLIAIDTMLRSKTYQNGIPLPNAFYLANHQILAWQINDLGHYYRALNLKTCYDSIVLKTHLNDVLLLDLAKHKFGRSYLELATYYFKEFSSVLSNNNSQLYLKLHLKYITNTLYKSGIKPIKQHYINFISRLHLAIYNKHYRLHALKKIFISKK